MSARRTVGNAPPVERAALVSLRTRAADRSADPDLVLDELAGLAQAAGATVALRAVQDRQTPDPATLIGRGKAEMLAVACDTRRRRATPRRPASPGSATLQEMMLRT